MAPVASPAGQFSVLYFAAASTFTKLTVEHFPAPIKAGDLYAKLEERHPGISDKILSSCAVTVNLEYVEIGESDGADVERVIKEADEVAIIPPVSSG